jgi:SulP family sulfate permease
VGVALAIVLFIRDQARGSVIRRKTFGNQVYSRRRRQPEEVTILERKGAGPVVCELEGSLFFGTTDQLFTALEADLKTCRFLILDLKLVRSMDLTAVHLLQQIEARLAERDAHLIFSNVQEVLPTGQHLRAYLEEVGLLTPGSRVRLFNELSDALEWTEDVLVAEEGRGHADDKPALGLREMPFLSGLKEERLQDLEGCVVERRCADGERVFSQGEPGNEIFLIRRGRVRIVLPIEDGRAHHLATFTSGDLFGDVAFIDAGTRSADAVADAPTDLYVLSRERFDALFEEHPRTGRAVFFALARTLAARLRRADGEIRALEGP